MMHDELQDDDDLMNLMHNFRANEAHPTDDFASRFETMMQHEYANSDADMEKSSDRQSEYPTTRNTSWLRRIESFLSPSGIRTAAVGGLAVLLIATIAFNAARPVSHGPDLPNSSKAVEAGSPGSRSGNSALKILANRMADDDENPRVQSSLGTPATSSLAASQPTMDQVVKGPSAMSPEQLSLIADDEDELLELLRAATHHEYGRDEDFGPFRVAVAYLADEHVSNESKVVFIRMLGRMKGINAGEAGTDAVGRSGIVVSRHDMTSGILQSYILDNDTGEMLEHREVIEMEQVGGCPAGTVVRLDVFVDSRRIIEGQTQTKSAEGSWPNVTPTCDLVLVSNG